MLNLHAIVRKPITMLHPDEVVALYRSVGQENVLGRISAKYAPGILVNAQIQTLTADELQQREETSKTGLDAKVYLFADEKFPPAGIVRHLARNGDFIRRADGTWCLVVSVIEDFTKSGWICVGISTQVKSPNVGDRFFGFVQDSDQTGTFGEAPFFVSNSLLYSVLCQRSNNNA